MRKFGAILYLLCASVLSLWCVARFIGPELPTFAMTEPPKRVELLFVGDVMVHSPQLTVAKQDNNYDFKGSFKYVKPIFEAADCVIANLETTINNIGETSILNHYMRIWYGTREWRVGSEIGGEYPSDIDPEN